MNIFIPSFAIQYPSYTTLVRLGQSLMRLHKLMNVFFTFNIQISNSNWKILIPILFYSEF